MKKITILLFSLFLSELSLFSQEKWTLRQCIDYAIENNIDIKQQMLNVRSSEVDVNTAKMSRLPNLNGNVGQNFSFGQSTGSNNVNSSANSSSTTMGLSTSMPLFTGFRIPNQIKMNELNLLAATEGLNKAKENMELQVTSLYLDVLFKKEIKKVYQEQLDLTTEQVGRTQTLVEAGKVPASQLYDIKAQQAKDELNLTTAGNDLTLSLLNLSQALNLTEYDNFDVVEPIINDVIGDNISSLLPPQSIYEDAIRIKPQVKEGEYKIESAKRNVKVAQSGYYPTIDFSAGYSTSSYRIYDYDNTYWKDQLRDNQRKSFGFSLNIPLFNRFQTRNQVRAAKLSVENNRLALDNIKLSLYKEIQQAYQNAVAAQSKFTSTEKAYEAADESFKYARERYDVGKSTVFELNEAQTKLLSSKSEQVQSKYDFLFRAKILDFYRGEHIDIK